MQSTKFKIGDKIRLKDDHDAGIGVVCKTIDSFEENKTDIRVWANWNNNSIPAWANEDEVELVDQADQWEYKEIKINSSGAVVNTLNKEGKEGWELVFMNNSMYAILKRKVIQ